MAVKKIAVLGENGFLGKKLVRLFGIAGHHVKGFSRGESPRDDEHFDLLVDATSQKNRYDLHVYLDSLKRFIHISGVKRIVFLQSFSTLQDWTGGDEQLLNFGVKCHMHTPYSKLKLEKELLLMSSNLGVEMKFLYLPIVLGAGGIWDSFKENLSGENVVEVPLVEGLHYTSIPYISKIILSSNETQIGRELVVEGRAKLTEILEIPEQRIRERSYKYPKAVSLFLLALYRYLKAFPLIPHALDFLLSKVFFIRSRSFPSFFYWELFKIQNLKL